MSYLYFNYKRAFERQGSFLKELCVVSHKLEKNSSYHTLLNYREQPTFILNIAYFHFAMH